MKHIKTYKIFESNDNVIDDLTEICYELTDGRFSIRHYEGIENVSNFRRFDPDDKILFIYLSDHMDYQNFRHLQGFSFDEVRETVLRVIDYLGDRYEECSVVNVGELTSNRINKREIIEHHWIGNLRDLVIVYKLDN